VLTEAQRDFDFVDEAALASEMKLEAGTFTISAASLIAP